MPEACWWAPKTYDLGATWRVTKYYGGVCVYICIYTFDTVQIRENPQKFNLVHRAFVFLQSLKRTVQKNYLKPQINTTFMPMSLCKSLTITVSKYILHARLDGCPDSTASANADIPHKCKGVSCFFKIIWQDPMWLN